jgi:FkbM family methyltransferase
MAVSGVRRPGRRRPSGELMLNDAVIATMQGLVANRVYVVRHGLARGVKRRGGLGFIPQMCVPRSREDAYLERRDFTGQTVYDIGGNEGIFTLLFARRVGACGCVVTFEANPRSHARILENVRLNGFTRVDVRRIALGAAPGRASLVFPTDEMARGSLWARSSLRSGRRGESQLSKSTSTRLIARSRAVCESPTFIKMDGEGFERDVLAGMVGTLARRRPTLYIELHGADRLQKLGNATAVVENLWGSGYRIHHVESARAIHDLSAIASVIDGHLHCSATTRTAITPA